VTAVVVIAVGNPFRGDDGAGIAVAAALRRLGVPERCVVESDGEPARMVEAWAGADVAIVVVAVRSGRVPVGDVHRLVVRDGGVSLRPGAGGSHGMGPGDAVELGEAVGRLPGRLLVYAIEGERFGLGDDLTPAVAAAIEQVAGELAALVGADAAVA
jgi:hydrogenase maturation protease